MPSHTGHHIYRCTPATRNRSYPGGHVARQAGPVEMFIEKLVVARLSRPDAADLVTAEDSGVDVAALREEATAIRVNLEEMASDRALGKITRAQMLKATEAGTARLDQIGAELDTAARENVLAPLVAAENAAAAWAGLDISRKRAVVKTLMSVTLYSPGSGAPPRVRPGHGPGHLEPAGHRLTPASTPCPWPACGVVCWSPAARAAQEQRERVPLLAGQRRSGSGQPGDVGIQAGLAVIIVGVAVVARALVSLAVCGRGRA